MRCSSLDLTPPLQAFLYIVGGIMVTGGLTQLVAYCFGRQIQTSPSRQKEDIPAELVQTVFGTGVMVACMAAWSMTRAELGLDIALRKDLADCGCFNR